MAIQSNLAGVARVAFEASTGEFNRDVDVAERNYRAATGHMSDSAIKLELAQERLRRALAKGPAAAQSQARALLSVRSAERELAAETGRTERSLASERREMDRLGRSAHSSGGALRGFGRTAAVTAGSFLGATGLIYGLRSAVTAAGEAELVLGQTKVAVETAGLSWERYAGRIEEVIRAQSRLGFDDEKLLKTFATFVTRTGQVEQSLRLNALAADVARGRYIDLEQAAQLVLKASLGQAGALRRLGIDAKNGASSVELLTLLTDKYAGRADAAATTGVAATQRLSVEWENAKEIVGQGLLPAITDLGNQLSDYLGDADRQEQLQRRVNEAVKDGAAVARGLAGGLRAVKSTVDPLVGLLGGFENAAQLAFGLLLVSRLRSATRALRIFRTEAATTATTVSTIGTNATTSLGQVGRLKGGLRGLGPLAAGVLPFMSLGSQGESETPTYVEENGRYYAVTRFGRIEVSEEQARRLAPKLFAKPVPKGFRGATEPGEGHLGRPGAGNTTRPGSATRPRRRTTQDFELDLARALRSPAVGDELRVLGRRESWLERQIRRLEADKNRTKAENEQLLRAYAELAQVEGQSEAILDTREAGRERKAAERARKAKERAERLAKANRAAEAAALGIGVGGLGGPAGAGAGAATGLGGGRGRAGTGSAASGGMTAADFKRMSFEFLQSLQGIQNQFGSNVTQGTAPQVTVNQNFPHPPTRDGHIEAIYSRHALERAFQIV